MTTAPPITSQKTEPKGLSSETAQHLLAQYGLNEPTSARQRSPMVSFFLLFVNPLALILLVAAGFSGFLGQWVDAVLLVVMVVLGISLNFLQTYRSERAIDALRQRVSTQASVLRDGTWQDIPRRELVPGDWIRLWAGDLVPADARLVEAEDLYVQQATLTGESLPVEKEAAQGRSDTGSPDTPFLVFLGTSVVSGSALAVVTATGPRTVFGGIAAKLIQRPPETEFERGLRQFSFLIMKVVLFLVLFLLTVNLSFRHDPFQSLLFAVALAVGLTPEFLPMITSVTLARGAVQMAQHHVIVKHLPAIQNLGSMDVLCSDKTGTLTSGLMRLEKMLDACGNASEHVLLLGYLNSQFETGIRNPLHRAILDHSCPGTDQYQKCEEIPFDFERRCVSVVVERNGKRLLILKGAPESVIPRCFQYACAEGEQPLSEDNRSATLALFHRLSADGYRVLAVGSRPIDSRSRYSVEDETELTLAGYLAFADPPRPDTAATLAALHQDGVRLKVLTGDNELVSQHIGRQVGLDVSSLVLGNEVAQMTDTALGHVVEQTTVFARISPEQKNRIIRALQQRGHVVGYLGDGINDTPSLHTADVGISVDGAADVAREAADMILVEPGLGVLHAGILEGRKASGNVLKYLLMGTSSNFGNMLSMAGASLFLPFLPMLPTQILLNNFLYDVAQITIPTDRVDAAYLQTPQRWNMSLIRRFMITIGPISSIFDFLTFFILLRYFHAHSAAFHTGWFIESLTTQTLVLFVIRTFGNPFYSQPSRPLAVTVWAVVILGLLIPFSPLASTLGFTSLPLSFFLLLIVLTGVYLLLVEVAKQQLFRSFR